MENRDTIPQTIDPEEYLYRGIVAIHWDYTKNRPSSAVFKCPDGVSVNRDVKIHDITFCVNALLKTSSFKAICRVKNQDVIDVEAISKYLPVDGNDYHCEIHDSETKIRLTDSKQKKLRDRAEVVYYEE